jgi:hypothetical protein
MFVAPLSNCGRGSGASSAGRFLGELQPVGDNTTMLPTTRTDPSSGVPASVSDTEAQVDDESEQQDDDGDDGSVGEGKQEAGDGIDEHWR